MFGESASDVFPFALVIADENLVVQVIRFHRNGLHVVGESEERGKVAYGQVAQSPRELLRKFERNEAADDESPFAERRHVKMIRIGAQSGLLDGFDDAPVGLAGE